MSDSDDTDILLLIPPDYFLATTEELQNLEQRSVALKENCVRCQLNSQIMPETAPTASYQFLPPNKKVELNSINVRLNTLEREENFLHFATPSSDISTISTSTVRTHKPSRVVPLGFVHSTPKGGPQEYPNDGVLQEIDNFLGERDTAAYVDHWNRHSDGYRLQHSNHDLQASQANSLPSALNHLAAEEHSQMPLRTTSKPAAGTTENLISLSEIWGKNGQATAIASHNGTQSALKEEQLRRQHLERTVHLLQTRLLEYQQRLSVAIEVDRAKDAALSNAQSDCRNLQADVQHLRDANQKLESDHREHNGRMDNMQQELAHAVNMAAKFQDKNEKLEAELATCSKKTNECSNLFRQQIEDLEIKLHACQRSEEYANNELSKLKDKLAKAEYQCEKLKLRCSELEKDCGTLKHQKEMLHEYQVKQKSRADTLEAQRKSLQESLASLTDNEVALKKKLELQQKSLKSHYQQQLENVVAQKLKEFQEQLDKTEEHLKNEARERERLIAERAMKQLELMNEKNELELNLLQEKHNEEVELYRIQLANASKKIDDLELKLTGFKSKRADIAEKLHNVMETQWQKALEILTSPNNNHHSCQTDPDSPEDNENPTNRGDAEDCETPKTSKHRKTRAKENNLNAASSNKEPPEPMDRLQAYIELLLSKSPSDFDKLDEILALTQKSKSAAGKLDKSMKRINAKPPWRA